MMQPRRPSESYSGSYGDFFVNFFSFRFKLETCVFNAIDCADTGSWWNWPWNKLDLSTSYLCPINIMQEIFLFKWGDGGGIEKTKKNINESFCFAAHTRLQVCLEWAPWQMTPRCAPTWCNAPQVHISLNLGFHGSLPNFSFYYCFVAFPLFCSLAVVTNRVCVWIKVEKSIISSVLVSLFLISICMMFDI